MIVSGVYNSPLSMTSSSVTKLKSPEMEFFNREAASEKSRQRWASPFHFSAAWI